MHDPCTVVFTVKYPWWSLPPSKTWPDGYRDTFITVWHVDPEKDGSDDSCDWFGGRKLTDKQKKVLDEITSTFAHEWNRDHPYERFGWFMPTGAVDGVWRGGESNYSTHSIVLSMFRIATNHHFGHWSRRADAFLRHYVFDILMFAENSTDSICNVIEQKHGTRSGSIRDQARRMAWVVYAWILRQDRPWWKHPRWHWWHWRIQVHPLQDLKRWLFSRCKGCGKKFPWGYVPVSGDWDADGPRWFRGEDNVYHRECMTEYVNKVANTGNPT